MRKRLYWDITDPAMAQPLYRGGLVLQSSECRSTSAAEKLLSSHSNQILFSRGFTLKYSQRKAENQQRVLLTMGRELCFLPNTKTFCSICFSTVLTLNCFGENFALCCMLHVSNLVHNEIPMLREPSPVLLQFWSDADRIIYAICNSLIDHA